MTLKKFIKKLQDIENLNNMRKIISKFFSWFALKMPHTTIPTYPKNANKGYIRFKLYPTYVLSACVLEMRSGIQGIPHASGKRSKLWNFLIYAKCIEKIIYRMTISKDL